MGMAHGSQPSDDAGAAPVDEEERRRAQEGFIDDLIARGEAVPEGEELPPGATHHVAVDEQGNRTVQRRRFSLY
ncbi:MAG TPA: hypothetical protein VFY17_01515 [Pilimelia sp.]|nr:hypothetical protein [Pilimelia sp.]